MVAVGLVAVDVVAVDVVVAKTITEMVKIVVTMTITLQVLYCDDYVRWSMVMTMRIMHLKWDHVRN